MLTSLHCFKRKSQTVLFNSGNSHFFRVDNFQERLFNDYFAGRKLTEADKISMQHVLRQVEYAPDSVEQRQPAWTEMESFKRQLKKGIRRLTFVVTNHCNLHCSYCYEQSPQGLNFGLGAKARLDFSLAKQGVENLLQEYDQIHQVMFFGGEPTTEIPLIEKICLFFTQCYEQKKLKNLPGFGIISNGTIYNQRIKNLFRKYNFSQTISLDGPREVNDLNRTYPGGQGSFNITQHNFKKMQQDGFKPGIQATITPAHIRQGRQLIDLAKFFNEKLGVKVPHIVPVQGESGNRLAPEAADDDLIIASYLAAQRDNFRAILSGRLDQVYLYSFFVGLLRALIRQEKRMCLCPAGEEIAIGVDGYFYPCFMFVNHDRYRLGPLDKKITDDYWLHLQAFMMQNIKLNKPECRDCYALWLCHGCMGNFINGQGNIQLADSRFCKLVKEIIRDMLFQFSELSAAPEAWRQFKLHYKQLLTGQQPVC